MREVEGRGLLVYGLSILLIRAIFVNHLPIQQLGLAIGVSGWLLQGNGGKIAPDVSIGKVWEFVGIILLFLGWLFSVGENFPWQAALVSFLALQFFGQRLRRDWLRLDLLAIYLIGLQGVFLIERLIPLSVRQDILDVWIHFTHNQNYSYSLYSLILFPYLLIFVGLTDWLQRQNKPSLGNLGEGLSLFLALCMTANSLLDLTARAVNLFLCTLLLTYYSSRRQPVKIAAIYLNHITALLTITSIVDWQFPSLSVARWIKILLGFMVGEWLMSTLQESRGNLTVKQVWYRSCWHLGFFFAFLSYILLSQEVKLFLDAQKVYTEELWWLLVPLTLTGVASRSGRKQRREAAFWSCVALIVAQTLTLWFRDYRLFSLAMGAGLMLFNTYYLRRLTAARIQIGFTLALQAVWLGRLLTTSFGEFFVSSQAIISDAITLVVLWLLNIGLKQRQGFLASLYAKAAEGWAIFLCVFNLLSLTVDCLGSTVGLFSLTWHSLVATLLIGAIVIYRYWQELNYWVVYGLVWIIEILVIQSVVLTVNLLAPNSQDVASIIATSNIILALFTLGFTGWLSAKFSSLSQLTSFQIFPLIIAIMGIGWRWGHFTAYTGLLTVGAGITGVMIGYRLNRAKILSYLAVAGISLGIYESAIYQMRQFQGEAANNIMSLAVITGVIALSYRLLAWFLRWRGFQNYLNLNLREIQIIAHAHWAIATVLKSISIMTVASTITLTSQLNLLLLIASLILPVYSLIQGRVTPPLSSQQNLTTAKDIWVYLGLFDVLATAVFARMIWQQLAILDPYRALIICALALILYYLPWQTWKWPVTPWQNVALLLPILQALIILPNLANVQYFNLLIIAGFYLQIALKTKNLRWTYISLFLLDYMILNWRFEQGSKEPLFEAFVWGFSLLYIAQIDQKFQDNRERKNRHYLRLLGSSIICVTALLFYQKTGLIPAIISLLTLLTGLGLQIRAFLFVGTTTFVMTGIYQVIIVSFQWSFIKWIIGLALGIILITVAANFERRREQMLNLWQNWLNSLNQWQ